MLDSPVTLHSCTPIHYAYSLAHITHKRDISYDLDITLTFISGGIPVLKNNPKQPSYPIIHQSLAIEAEADVSHCCIISVLLVQVSHGEGCNKGNE